MSARRETRLIVGSTVVLGALLVLLALIAHQSRPDFHHPGVDEAPLETSREAPELKVTETTLILEPGPWPGVFITGECHYQDLGPAGFDAALSDGLQGQSLVMNGFPPPDNYPLALACLETVLGTAPTMKNLLTVLQERVQALGRLPTNQ